MYLKFGFLKFVLTCVVLMGKSYQKNVDDGFKSGYVEYVKSYKKAKEKLNGQHKDDITSLLLGTPPTCINKKSRSSLSFVEYLREFAKGPCSPIMLVPGIGGSKLIVSINCTIFKEKNPKLFETCGWNTCNSELAKRQARLRKPEDEYLVWVPPVDSPFSIANPFSNGAMCFTGVMGFDLVFNSTTDKIETKSLKGISINPIGMSKMTSKRECSGCGFEAVEDLLPLAFQPSEYRYFDDMKDILVKAGYEIGLTIQALPYDWRKGYRENHLDQNFEKILDEMYELLGKRVTIISHSMGNYQVIHNLWKMKQEKKDKKIARWLSFAPPFLGSVLSSMNLLGLDEQLSLNVKLFSVGVTAHILKNTINTYPTNYQLGVKRFFRVHRNEPWMKAIMDRISLEEAEDGNPGKKANLKGTIMDIFPEVTDVCTDGFSYKDKYCKIGLHDFWNFGQIEDLEINPDTLNDVLDIYGVLPLYSFLNKKMFDKRFEVMPNPGVQINVIYSSVLPTMSKIIYTVDPKSFTMFDHVYPPDRKEFSQGDGEVLVTSSLAPAIKWAYEFDQKVEGAKPVNIIEICSTYHQRGSVFEDSGDYSVKKNAYFGMDCDCKIPGNIIKSDGKGCNHKNIVADENVVKFTLESVKTGEVGEIGGRFKKFSDEDFTKYVDLCYLLQRTLDKESIEGK